MICFSFFFFQAEDGIRDTSVTGVQTCALPISSGRLEWNTDGAKSSGVIEMWCITGTGPKPAFASSGLTYDVKTQTSSGSYTPRSEERRVGKECRTRWCANRVTKIGP